MRKKTCRKYPTSGFLFSAAKEFYKSDFCSRSSLLTLRIYFRAQTFPVDQLNWEGEEFDGNREFGCKVCGDRGTVDFVLDLEIHPGSLAW